MAVSELVFAPNALALVVRKPAPTPAATAAAAASATLGRSSNELDDLRMRLRTGPPIWPTFMPTVPWLPLALPIEPPRLAFLPTPVMERRYLSSFAMAMPSARASGGASGHMLR